MLDRFLEQLKSSDLGRKLLLNEAERARVERQTLVTEYTALDVDARATIERLRPGRDKTLAALQKARLAVDKLQAQFRAEENAIFDIKTQASTRRRQIERLLQDGADPAIATAVARLDARLTTARAEGVLSDTMLDQSRMPATMVHRSNAAAFGRIVIAVRTARGRLEQLKLQHVDDVGAVIADIEASVPWSDLGELTAARFASADAA
jgi:hypothetical protein